ncbi:class I adenylate-forming enzyme family protein [Niallia sp. Krafla_26]|uniref:class I adenylate-forming enzyme family protein n=1 Tax=Niallia sp. Krafla_26 TaxID=3064703 RepID=UPI003D16C1A4
MNNLYNWIFDQKLDFNKQILSTQSGNYTYQDIYRGVEQNTNLLERIGNVKKKRVALIVPSVFQFTTLSLAISKLEGIIIPLSPLLRKDDLVSLLDFLNPHIVFTISMHNGFHLSETVRDWALSSHKDRIILTQEENEEWSISNISGEKNPLEEVNIQILGCTSGSTGMPKGIVYDVDFVKRVDDGIKVGLHMKQNDKLFLIAPATGVFGLAWILSSLHSQNHLVIPENFNFLEIIQLFEHQPSEKLITTPSLFKAFDLYCKSLNKSVINQVSLLCVFGEMVTPQFIKTYSDLHAKIMSFLGITEFGTVMYTEEDIRNGISWTLLPNVDYKLESPNEEGIGELLFKCESPFLGYYNRPDLTNEVFKNGWFFSGDLGRVTPEGKIEMMGRKKDMIKKGGQQVIPGEIESFLTKYPGVHSAVVVGVPHPVFGEQIVAFVQKDNELTINDLYEYCNNRIARYKIPDQILTIDEYPMIQGKIDKVTLRKKVTINHE